MDVVGLVLDDDNHHYHIGTSSPRRHGDDRNL